MIVHCYPHLCSQIKEALHVYGLLKQNILCCSSGTLSSKTWTSLAAAASPWKSQTTFWKASLCACKYRNQAAKIQADYELAKDCDSAAGIQWIINIIQKITAFHSPIII